MAKAVWYQRPIMDWIWYIQAVHNKDGTVAVLLHDRKRLVEHFTPLPLMGTFELIEESGRILTGLTITHYTEDGKDCPVKTYTVSNSKHVFSYAKFPED